jgi:hypothetical protein
MYQSIEPIEEVLAIPAFCRCTPMGAEEEEEEI